MRAALYPDLTRPWLGVCGARDPLRANAERGPGLTLSLLRLRGVSKGVWRWRLGLYFFCLKKDGMSLSGGGMDIY